MIPVKRKTYDWQAIQEFYDAGNGFRACQLRFKMSHAAWCAAASRGQLVLRTHAYEDRRQKFDWNAIQRYYNEGHSYAECRERFQFSPSAWSKAVLRGAIATNGRNNKKLTLAELHSKKRTRSVVRRVLLREGILELVCAICGTHSWLGRPLSLHLDHINGVADDHRHDNLRMLCPNCHSQTETYAGRNLRRRKACKKR